MYKTNLFNSKYRQRRIIKERIWQLGSNPNDYKSHTAEFETIRDYDYEKQQHGNRDLNEIIEMDKELEFRK